MLTLGDNENGLLCDEASHDQIVVPRALSQRVLHIHQYVRLTGHTSERKLYQAIQKDIYWPVLAMDWYSTFLRCSTSTKSFIQLHQHVLQLQLFPTSVSLQATTINDLGELVKISRGNQYLPIISKRFTTLTKSVALKSISISKVAKAFVNK